MQPDSTVVVIGAAGEVGRAVLEALGERPELRLIAVDIGSRDLRRACDRSQGDLWVSGDITDPSAEVRSAIETADVVVLAVPEVVAERASRQLFDGLTPGSLVVDTLSVKSSWFESIADLEPSIEVLSINPMFAPSLGFAGRPVAMIEFRPGPRSAWFIKILHGFGCTLVPVGRDEHDLITASVQVATHAAVLTFGLAIEALGHDVDRLSPLFTPPHRTLVALLSRICAGDGHVYHDIQHHNRYAGEARRAMENGLRTLSELSVQPDPADFSEMTGRLRTMLGERGRDYEQLCAELFSDSPTDVELRATGER